MKRGYLIRFLSFAIMTAFMVAACSPAVPDGESSLSPSATPTPTVTETPIVIPEVNETITGEPLTDYPTLPAAPGAVTDEFNNVVNQIGEAATVTDKNDEIVFSLTVNSYQVVPSCPGQFAGPPENGNYLVLDITAKVSATADKDFALSTQPTSWYFITDDGEVIGKLGTEIARHCFDLDQTIPAFVLPGREVTGYVVFDVPVTHGRVQFSLLEVSRDGWTWPIG